MAICSDERHPTAVGLTQSGRRLWWFFLACIAIVNGCYLFEPVYWDMLTGMFMQAYWLAKNNLDYFSLLQQPRWMANGPCVYPSAWLMSLVYGGLYYLRLPPAAVNLIGHVLVWICGATILYTVARMLEAYCDRATRLLTCLLLFTSPLFLSQTAAFNMEAPLAALSALAFYYCLKRRYGTSVLLSLVAFHVHPRGVLILLGNATISVFDVLLALWLRRRIDGARAGGQPANLNGPLVSVALHGLSFAIFFAYLTVNRGVSDIARPFAAIGAHPAAYLGIPEFTLAILFFLFCFSVVVGHRGIHLLRDRSSADVGAQIGEASVLDSPAALNGVVLRSGLFLLACIAFFLNLAAILPRYYLIIYPIVAVGIVSLFVLKQVSRRIVLGVLISGIGWNVLNYRGLCYIPCEPNIGAILERSSEYHAHVQLHKRLARYVESEFDLTNTIFVTDWPNVQVLAIPEAGYVTSPDIQVASTRPLLFAGVGSLTEIYRISSDGEGVEQITDKEVVWIFSRDSFHGPFEKVYGLEDERRDGQLAVMKVGDRSLDIYKRPRVIANEEFAEFLAPAPCSPYSKLPPSTWGKTQ